MAREYFSGMGEAVAARTINRKGEKWGDVAKRVAFGNTSITNSSSENLERHIANATVLMSGRHLQHGDSTQPGRNIEVFSNCSTSAQRSILFYLLLNGSGVGTSYDDAICIVDFRKMPKVTCVISASHPDVLSGRIKGYASLADVSEHCRVFDVPDSREGWAEAVEQVEIAAWEEQTLPLVLDFSNVRPHGAPIGGMQDRPASGPGPLMDALTRVAAVKYQDWEPWRQAMQIDHELAECVLVGGARRAARIAVKNWRDPGIKDFIHVKELGGLWSANNSVGVDAKFWATAHDLQDEINDIQYHTGEPGYLNLDLLTRGESRPTLAQTNKLAGKYILSKKGLALRACLSEAADQMQYFCIVNPCGEIRLNLLGSYCVIADVVPYFAATDEDAEDAFRETTIALLRTNMLTALYQGEVDRTNRIGVGLTGIFEYAWDRFGYNWHDLVSAGSELMTDANGNQIAIPDRSLPFWLMLSRFAGAVTEAATEWCLENDVAFPTTLRTIKPAGTTSKLFGLTEGAHLPPMREYLRWVQFRSDDPLIEQYRAEGYPVRDLISYTGTTIVGFPTQPLICTLDPDVVTAPEATPEEQFRWVRLLETFWLGTDGGNQVSYTLKFDPETVSVADFGEIVRTNMPLVRAISVLPKADMSIYEYQPEEPITREAFEALKLKVMKEDIDMVHVDCAGGACPINFSK